VATNTPGALVDLLQLRLDNARALLGYELTANLPSPQEFPAEYLQGVIDGLCELSLKDPLTGLANRRYFRNVMDRTIDMVARSGDPALLLMLDIDHFKKVNDTYGHQAGDQVLQAVAKALTKCVRPMDTVARYGGEEFVAILPNCHAYFGEAVAERIRQTIEDMPIEVAPGTVIRITISIGGAYAPEWVRSTAALWTERADVQLYRAKAEGRNRVLLDHQQEIFVSAEEKNMLFGHLALGDPAWIESVSGDPAGNGASGSSPRIN
jgi:two-component system cell cycle response regulator